MEETVMKTVNFKTLAFLSITALLTIASAPTAMASYKNIAVYNELSLLNQLKVTYALTNGACKQEQDLAHMLMYKYLTTNQSQSTQIANETYAAIAIDSMLQCAIKAAGIESSADKTQTKK